MPTHNSLLRVARSKGVFSFDPTRLDLGHFVILLM
jgi:hypothetical protein